MSSPKKMNFKKLAILTGIPFGLFMGAVLRGSQLQETGGVLGFAIVSLVAGIVFGTLFSAAFTRSKDKQD